ncbi:MAG: hypothetical protein ABL929_03185 [Ferruginibacter sp.]|nr:hypothetical protein [Ferruginibacter sp.]
MCYNIKNKIAFVFTLCILSISSNAQFSDEDMLDNLAINATPLWKELEPAFVKNDVPEKYKEESAIVFGYKRNVTIDKKSRSGFFTKGERSLLFFENVHFKIKLNDKSAVQTFTEIYFRYRTAEDGFSAKITKPDGTITTVLLNDAVAASATENIPEFYKSFFDQENGGQSWYFKVAIPDLEPNDILEYVTITKSKLDVSYAGYIEFSPQYEVCNKAYPVLFNQITIETDDKSFFKSLALNGAPDFKKEATNDSEFYRYTFTDTDRGVEKDVNFVNTLLTNPVTKFQVIYANKANTKGALIGEKGEIKKRFTKEELAKKAWEDYVQVGGYAYNQYGVTVGAFEKALWKDMVKIGAKKWDENEFIEKAYYRLRNIVVYRDTYMNDKMFSYIFRAILNEKDIPSDLVISISNTVGKLKDILFDQEIKYCTKVNGKLYFNATDYSNPGELVENLLGNEAYIIREPEKNSQEIIDFTFPNATALENNSNYEFTSTLNKDMSTLSVSRTSTYKGIAKTRNISDALKYTTYMLDDYKYYGGDDPRENMKEKQEDEYYKSINAVKESYKEQKPILVKNNLQGEYDNTVKFKNFSVTNDGRSLKKQELIFTEEFELSGMVRKAGKKYLVNVIGLVGSQLQIRKEERVRKYDINVGIAKSYFWTINFQIPEGYTAEGIAELATEVTNETGTYASTAVEKNGVITIRIKKLYKSANVAKEKWADMLAFLDAAYNNSFKYILLKPKN